MNYDLVQCRLYPSRRATRSRPTGFTLIEMLVVVAVIGLLIGMLLPSLATAKLLAKQTACQASLRALGVAAGAYRCQFGDYVPICWQNLDSHFTNPWKSWRTNLLPYVASYAAFNCPAARDTGQMGEVFHSAAEVTGHDLTDTANAGSYGVMYQYSLPSYETPDYSGILARGHPAWSLAFSSLPGVAWRDPANSVYVADAYLAKGPIAYPSRGYKGYGTSVIVPPSTEGYFGSQVTRRFADRHLGSNCLFVGGQVIHCETESLDHMSAGAGDCVWDTD